MENNYSEKQVYVIINNHFLYHKGYTYPFNEKSVRTLLDYSYDNLKTAKQALYRLKKQRDKYFLATKIYSKDWQLKKIIYRTAFEVYDV